ncbi:unnamed protein product [Staurois parvus]|uniref:Uncharacterized protein n=1 Tax=Staurois parvus TaxID=386267 RepID=A0ABN9HCU3_9NEOB|nr:unnamed protein product [Staurois parvus]
MHIRPGVDLPFGYSSTARGPGVSRGPHEMSLVPFIGFFGCGLSVARTQGPHDPLLPLGPGSVGGPMRCPWYLFHRLF